MAAISLVVSVIWSILTRMPGASRGRARKLLSSARWLDASCKDGEIVKLSGAVEIAPRLGRADLICDLVSTGSTLQANHLHEALTTGHRARQACSFPFIHARSSSPSDGSRPGPVRTSTASWVGLTQTAPSLLAVRSKITSS